MPERKALMDSNETPEDVATLYSWANLHGAKYRDFSASRAQTREKARLRVQDAIESERRRAREEAEAQKNAEAQIASESAIMAEAARKQELAIQEKAQRAEQQAAQPRMWQSPRPPAPTPAPVYQAPAQQPQPTDYAYAQTPAYVPAHSQPSYAPSPYPPQAVPASQNPYAAPMPAPYAAPMSQPAYGQAPVPVFQPQPANPMAYAQPASQFAPGPEAYSVRDDHYMQVRTSWAPAETREPAARPAWLTSDRPEPVPPMVPQAPEETLQASRDRLTSRWFALKGVFADPSSPLSPFRPRWRSALPCWRFSLWPAEWARPVS